VSGAFDDDPALRARCEAAFDHPGFFHHIGATLVAVRRGEAVLRVERGPAVLQHHGFIHGGVVGALADGAMGTAAFTTMPEGSSILTVEYKVNFLRPAAGRALLARARVVKPGLTLTVVSCDLFSEDDEGRETHCAAALSTMIRLHAGG